MSAADQKQEVYPQQYNEPPPAYNPQYGSQYPPNPQMPQPQYNPQYGQPAPSVNWVGGLTIQQAGQCLHYNQVTSYNPCALACIIILCVEFFPLGLCALFCLGTITQQKCFNCGHQVTSNLTAVYVTFGILQLVFVGLVALDVYLISNMQTNYYNNYN